jgi:hypothetical protein
MDQINGRYAICTDAIYRVDVPGTDISFLVEWTGRVRKGEDGYDEFELKLVDGGKIIIVPVWGLQDIHRVSPLNTSEN